MANAKIKLSNVRLIGRRINPATGRAVNVWRGKDKAGWTKYFYLFRQGRVWLGEEIWKWEKVNPV